MDDRGDRGDSDLNGPTLNWEGKGGPDIAALSEALNALWDGEPVESIRGGNLLLRADAHAAAAWLLPELESMVDLIYIDPPFAVGVDFDAAVRPSGGGWQFAYCDRWPTNEVYLNFLHHLVVLAHRLLADGGSLYLHVDRRTSHWARCILAEVFGAERDRGAIAWHLGNGVKSKAGWGCSHNDILCFSKGDAFKFRAERAALREPYAASSLGTHFRGVDDDGRRYRDRTINGRRYRYYADEGRLVGSVWTDCPSMAARSPIMDESTGYPTQKPEKLLERIIEASSDPGDLVVDLCCGSGTTPAVAQRLGRRWIAADVGRFAVECTAARMRESGPIAPVAICDLVERTPERPTRLARLLGMTRIELIREGGIRGSVPGRSVAVWPHGVKVTDELLGAAFDGHGDAAECAAFATAFAPKVPRESGVACWRYHPEAASAASLRSVILASPWSATVLSIIPGTKDREAVWAQRPLDHAEIMSRSGGGVVDVFGFTHTLESIAAAGIDRSRAEEVVR